IHPGKDGTTEDGRLIDRYFGTKISGGFGKSGEGPYVTYDKATGYYYLYVTYGWLAADGEYNMRLFRAENPEGPYLDISGQNAVLTSNADHSPIGNKLIGHFLFERKQGDPGTGVGYGYVSSGHNSAYSDPDTVERFLVFHTRFPNRGEAFELRIHQMFMNEDEWLVVAPSRYTGEKLEKINPDQIIGEYQFVNHEKDISKTIKKSVTITLNEDGTIAGPVNGTWELVDDYYATLTIDGKTYKGVFVRQWNEVTESTEMAFTAVSEEGKSIWGIRKTYEQSDVEIVEIVKEQLTLGDTTSIDSNLDLPSQGIHGAKITWQSSNEAVVSNEGIVTRPAPGSGNAEVTLTATITKGEASTTKTFTIIVVSEGSLVAHYSFDDDLVDNSGNSEDGTVTGNRIDAEGGTITYQDGVIGKAAYFNGDSGVLLPKGLIKSNQYTVSLWLKPEQITQFTTTFFGARATNSWSSFIPSGHDNFDKAAMLWSGEQWYDAPTGFQLKPNEWTHVAFSVDKGKVDIYIDGVNKFSSTGFPNVFTTDDAVFALGVNYWDTPYKGFMDELLVYENMVLTEEEIQEYSELISLNFYTKELEELVQKAKGISNVDNLYTTDSLSSLSVAIEEAENALLSLDSVEGL